MQLLDESTVERIIAVARLEKFERCAAIRAKLHGLWSRYEEPRNDEAAAVIMMKKGRLSDEQVADWLKEARKPQPLPILAAHNNDAEMGVVSLCLPLEKRGRFNPYLGMPHK